MPMRRDERGGGWLVECVGGVICARSVWVMDGE